MTLRAIRYAALGLAAAATAVALATAPAPLGAADALADVKLRDYPLPNATGMYDPHDPAADAAGNVWYTGFGYNAVGRVDAKTGEVKEYPLPTPTTGPHGITVDKQGMVWFTGNRSGLIGKLDPATGTVVEFKMPDPAVRDPHTPIFDAKGTLWFTVQMGDYVGKLDPATGAISVKAVATPKANPHGIIIDSKGTPIFAMSATNKIGIVNPQTMEIAEHVLPEGARPRRVAVTPDDQIWYTDEARGFIARLDPKTDQVREYPTPGGPKAGPWSIAVTKDGIIWYTESDAKPNNNLVRFDPKSGAMQSWPLPTPGGVVRHMVATADGRTLWLAQSGVAKMVRADISK